MIRIRRMAGVMVGFTILVAALTFAAPSTQAESVLRIVPQADLKILDPHFTRATITKIYAYFVYDRLFEYNDKAQPTPQMVESYEVSPDNMTYTMTLRKDLAFHDGRPVTTDDVLASMKHWGTRGLGLTLMERVKSLEKVDDRTFRINMAKTWSLVLDSLGSLQGSGLFILPERIAMQDPKKQITETIGSGPFKFDADNWVPGNKVTFLKNEAYVPRTEKPTWTAGRKEPRVDKVEWVIISDQQTQLAALRAGEVDILEDPAVDLVQLVAKDPNITVSALDPLGRHGYIIINHLYPPFDNVKARQALMWMVNQAEYMTVVAGAPENWTECYAYFVCGGAYAHSDGSEALAHQDLEKAKQLLKEAGYNGEPLTLLASTTHAFLNSAALVTTQNLRKMGVNVDLQQLDWGTVLARRASRDVPDGRTKGWHMYHTATKAINPTNPGIWGTLNGRCDKGNPGWVCNPRIEELKGAFADATSEDEKQAIAKELQLLIYDDVPFVLIGQWKNLAAYRKNLEGFVLSPIPVYWNVSKN